MERDSVLGWILIIMVGISLFLSYAIWARIPGEKPTELSVQSEKKVDLSAVVSPDKILLHLGNASHTMVIPSSPFYDRLWNLCKKTISQNWVQGKAAPSEFGPDFFEQKESIEVFLPVSLPMPFLKQMLNVPSEVETGLENLSIKSIILVEDNGLSIYFKDSTERYFEIKKGGDSKEISALVEEIQNSSPPLYASIPPGNLKLKIEKGIYVSLHPYDLAEYDIMSEKVVSDRIAPKFFPDFSVVRKIGERDGAVIYTDGQRGLRIYSDGSLEYSFPGVKEQKKNVSFYDTLKIAVDFVSSHGGWPEGGYLYSYSTSEDDSGPSCKFIFRIRINGHPLVAKEDYLTVTVSGTQVKNYYRNVALAGESRDIVQLMSPVKVIDFAVSTKNIKDLENMYPAYIEKSKKYIPAWVIKSDGHEIVLNSIAE